MFDLSRVSAPSPHAPPTTADGARAKIPAPAPSAPAVSAPPFATDAERYAAVAARDSRADGIFFYSVLTTGVYCRPSCAARLAKRENVGFHRTVEDAERAGYRPCKRCRPREASARERQAHLIQLARQTLETAESPPSLDELARGAGLSPYYFHRLFKSLVGMTPREYFAAHRLGRFRKGLREGASVTEAVYDAGYGSSSRFYEEDAGALGMSPSSVRKGGLGEEISVTIRRCWLGSMLVAATKRGVCAVAFGDSDDALLADLKVRFPSANVRKIDDPNDELHALAAAVEAMLDHPGTRSDVPLDLVGTAFQRKVWQALRDVPAGETVSYGELAKRIGAPRAVRAVGTACGQNPVAVVVPCHRVVRETGDLGGYRWGVERKKALLARERSR